MTRMFGTWVVAVASLVGCGPSGGSSTTITSQPQALQLQCAPDSGADDSPDWVCPESFQVACDALDQSTFVVRSPSGQACDPDALQLSHAEPLTPGPHVFVLRDTLEQALCSSDVTVVRGSELKLVPKPVRLWPPNHKLHEIAVEDCVEIVGLCPGEALDARFIWASSDEPVDARGDGSHAPDIVLGTDCQRVSLRSERQGPSDGRVYRLGVRVVDENGDAYETACTASVDHDRSGADAGRDADAYRIDFDGATPGAPSCGDSGR